MNSKTFVAAIAAFASVFPVAFAGSATIQNQCSDDVYLWSIADSAGAEMKTLHSGGSYTEKYRSNGNGGGVSMKLSLDKNQDKVTQFEYTLNKPKIYYDLSNINGYPFKNGGVTITPSDGSCPTVSCSAGDGNCQQAYNKPDDDHATHGCPDSSDLHVVLCGGKQGAKLKQKDYIPRHPHAPAPA
ncbi:hypothetical protein PRK78_005973 [Emydomyces testavorans]|uniref:Uncharacterized protein n=1 Tax=Emydomyces testavorans TaxID=2070801 RepID=A0AAF0DN82_9EURO|nr:hypothetical protein PRK78_005973 [Emydomyces testavorans]